MPMCAKPNVWQIINEPTYQDEPWAYLETADRRLFTQPYGPRFPEAVGKVFCLEPIQGGERTEVKISYVRMIAPWIFDDIIGDRMRIKISGELTCRGERFALAKILSSPDGMIRKDSGTWILLALYSNLTEETRRALLIQSIIGFLLDNKSDAAMPAFFYQIDWTKANIAELEFRCLELVGSLPY